MFKEGKTKFALLSLLSALVVASTAFVGVSIYAQTADDSELTTFEEEAIVAGEQFEDTMNLDDAAWSDSASEYDGSSTSTADVRSLLDGLVVCDVGTTEVSGETQTASSFLEEIARIKPTVSVSVMSETEVAALADSETETAASADDESTSTASADCVLVGEDEADEAVTSGGGTTSSASEESDTTSTSALDSDRQILVIEGQDFVPGQVVLMFIENELRGIDDVDDNGEIEAKIPVPENSETAVAGTGSDPLELRLVESGTQRTANLDFDGETLTASANSDIVVDDGEASTSDNGEAATNDTSATNNNTNTTTQ
ncbi:MAG: hypothetical protein AB1351_12125 [Thermoproteota archaeon]